MSKGMRVGYIRVSTIEQNIDRQLENIPLDKTFVDRFTGKVMNRPEFEAMMSYVREGDHLFVHSMDRLARNLDNLRFIVKTLTQKGVKVQFLKENLIFTGDDSAMSQLLLSLMGAFAEFECAFMRERQREGIAIAKAKGVYGGRPKSLKDDQVKELKECVSGGMHKSIVAKKFGISRYSVYRYMKE